MTAQRQPITLPGPLHIRLLAVFMTVVVSGLGVIHIITEHVPGRWTKHGWAGPLDGTSAQTFGLSIFFFGLLPLMLAAPSRRSAMWIGCGAAALGLATIFLGLFIL